MGETTKLLDIESPRRIVQFDSHWLPLNTRGRWQRVEIDLGVARKRLEDQ